MRKENEEADEDTMRLVLMGDDVFDDYEDRASVDATATDISKMLKNLLDIGKSKVEVLNCAVGKSVVANVSGSIWPDSKRKARRKAALLSPYPTNPKDGHVYPLKYLSDSKATHAILSVGWNDVKITFVESTEEKRVSELLREANLESQLSKLVTRILKRTHRLIIVFFYLPYHTRMHKMFRLPETKEAAKIVSAVATMFHKVAIKYKVPIVDLSRSINPYDSSLYIRDDPTRLSNKGRSIAAGLISGVITKYAFDDDSDSIPKAYSRDLSKRVRIDRIDGDLFPGRQKSYDTLLKHFLFDCEHAKNGTCVVS